jgi:hypothetical protein
VEEVRARAQKYIVPQLGTGAEIDESGSGLPLGRRRMALLAHFSDGSLALPCQFGEARRAPPSVQQSLTHAAYPRVGGQRFETRSRVECGEFLKCRQGGRARLEAFWKCRSERVTTETRSGSTPAKSARNLRSSAALSSEPFPIVAEVATKRTSDASTSNECSTLRSSSAISAACEPRYVCASSSTIHLSFPFDGAMMR